MVLPLMTYPLGPTFVKFLKKKKMVNGKRMETRMCVLFYDRRSLISFCSNICVVLKIHEINEIKSAMNIYYSTVYMGLNQTDAMLR